MLHYHSIGSEDKPQLILLHGFLGDHHDWDTVSEALKEHFCCMCLDLPGHGLSPSAKGMSFDDAADAIVATMDRADVAHATVAGYSMGGRIALHTVLRHPDRFAGLVMESASAGIAHDRERAIRREKDMQMADELEGMELRAFLRWWYSQPMFASLARRPDLMGTVLMRRGQQNPQELAHALRAFSPGVQAPLWDRLGEVSVPALLLAGEEDAKYVVITRSLFGRLLEQDRGSVASAGTHAGHVLKIVPNCGHNIHLEDTGTYCYLVQQFLSAVAV